MDFARDARLDLALLDTAGVTGHPRAQGTARFLTARTLERGDGYAARDVLAHPAVAAALTLAEQQQLAESVSACGLDQGGLPAELHETFGAALNRAASALTRILAASR
ncbi:hypothetical protein [Streptomyces sp. Y1]|uniref:Uncharacterized protein n=1 Tax=Streptomyces sp. Y1 TaxID=3238634 RepID=A0AB39TVE2_9ACTN